MIRLHIPYILMLRVINTSAPFVSYVAGKTCTDTDCLLFRNAGIMIKPLDNTRSAFIIRMLRTLQRLGGERYTDTREGIL